MEKEEALKLKNKALQRTQNQDDKINEFELAKMKVEGLMVSHSINLTKLDRRVGNIEKLIKLLQNGKKAGANVFSIDLPDQGCEDMMVIWFDVTDDKRERLAKKIIKKEKAKYRSAIEKISPEIITFFNHFTVGLEPQVMPNGLTVYFKTGVCLYGYKSEIKQLSLSGPSIWRKLTNDFGLTDYEISVISKTILEPRLKLEINSVVNGY